MNCCCGTMVRPETALYILTMAVLPVFMGGHRFCCRRCTLGALSNGETWTVGHAKPISIQTATVVVR